MRVRLRTCVGIAAWALAACANPDFDNVADPNNGPPVLGMLIDDYNDGTDPNLLGNCSALFDDRGAVIQKGYTTDRAEALNGVGASRIVQYDVSGANDPFGGYIETLTDRNPCPRSLSDRGVFNLSVLGFRTLSFWARAPKARTHVEVALKDDDECQGYPKRLVELSATWRKYDVPVADLLIGARVGLPEVECNVDLRRLRELNFGFANAAFAAKSAPLTGTVFLDNVGFER